MCRYKIIIWFWQKCFCSVNELYTTIKSVWHRKVIISLNSNCMFNISFISKNIYFQRLTKCRWPYNQCCFPGCGKPRKWLQYPMYLYIHCVAINNKYTTKPTSKVAVTDPGLILFRFKSILSYNFTNSVNHVILLQLHNEPCSSW